VVLCTEGNQVKTKDRSMSIESYPESTISEKKELAPYSKEVGVHLTREDINNIGAGRVVCL
jgi:hypothetical protein